MKILFVAPDIPYPSTNGGKIVVFETIKHLTKKGHQVDFLFLTDKNTDKLNFWKLSKWCKPYPVFHNCKTSWIGLMFNIFSKKPYSIAKYHSDNLNKQFVKLLENTKYDIIQFEGLFVAYLINTRYKTIGLTPVILREHNIESVIIERLFRNRRVFPVNLFLRVQYKRLFDYEARICAKFNRCFMISPIDKQKLEEMNPNVQTKLIPGGVDTSYFFPQIVREDLYSIVYVGSMDWLPNADGIFWFCKDIFPCIKQKISEAKLYIVGKNPPAYIKKLQDQDIIITGFVEDVRKYIAKGQVFIVPLRIGSGMRIKILNTFAMGKAVVSTSVGCEGIDVVDGKNIYIADSKKEFAKKVIFLLNNKNERDRIGKEGLKLVKEKYQWGKIAEDTEIEYKKIINENNIKNKKD